VEKKNILLTKAEKKKKKRGKLAKNFPSGEPPTGEKWVQVVRRRGKKNSANGEKAVEFVGGCEQQEQKKKKKITNLSQRR